MPTHYEWAKNNHLMCKIGGGETTLTNELYGRAADFRLVQDFRTDWMSSLSTGGA